MSVYPKTFTRTDPITGRTDTRTAGHAVAEAKLRYEGFVEDKHRPASSSRTGSSRPASSTSAGDGTGN